MEISKKELILVTVLLLFSLYVWTLPIQENQLPFGENDAAHQYTLGDYMATYDKAITRMPRYLFLWYGSYVEKNNTQLQYPPPTHINYAISQTVSGERIVPVHIYIALSCSLFVVSVFFLVRKLFGRIPSYAVFFVLIFSMRNIMSYLWGQRGTVLSFSYFPLVIYVHYKYVQTKKPIYIYIIALLLYAQFVFHLMGVVVSLLIMGVYSLVILIRKKRINLHYKHLFIAALLFLIMASPFIPIYTSREESLSRNAGDVAALFYWYKVEGRRAGYPDFFYYYSEIYGGKWGLPFFFLGILILIFRRNEKDWFMISWLISLYLILHLDFIGVWGAVRSARALIIEEYLFYPLMILGAFLLPSFLKINKQIKTLLRIALVALFLVLFIIFHAKPVYQQLDGAYGSILRITTEQYEVANWIDETLPENAILTDVGILTYAKARFVLALSHRFVNWHDDWNEYIDLTNRSLRKEFRYPGYFIFDYSDVLKIGDGNKIGIMQQWEKNLFINQTPMYNKNNIRVYKNEKKVW